MRSLIFFTLLIAAIFTSMDIYSQQSLSLQESKTLALEHNYKLRMATEQVGAANALSKSARTNFFPSISSNGLYTRTNKQINLLQSDLFIPVVPFTSIDPATGQFNPNLDPANTFAFNPYTGEMLYDSNGNPIFQNYSWLPKDELNFGQKNIFLGGISLTQPIFAGGKIREMYRISQFVENAAKANLTKEETELLYKVEENYWRVVSLQEKVRMIEKYIALLNKLGTDLNNLYNEGIILKNDVLRVNVKANEAKLNLLQASNGLTLSRMALCQLTGLPLSSSIVLSDTLNIEQELEIEDNYIELALSQRPELEALQQSVNIAQSGVKLMKSRFLPDIGLTANYMMVNPNPYNGFSNEFGGDWSIGVAISIPIFHWNDRSHTLRAARHEQNAMEYQLKDARELISLQVQQAIFATTESTKKLQMVDESLQLAEENLRVASNSFAEGMVKTTDVLEAQALWQNAWSDLIDARMEFQLSRVNLRKVIGKIEL